MASRPGAGIPARPRAGLFEPPGFLRATPAHVAAALMTLVLAMLAGGFFAYNNYPRAIAPDEQALEKQIGAVFGDPTVAGADERVSGDLLVERFYILDVVTGASSIVDFLKGRIEAVDTISADAQDQGYVYLLDLKDLSRNRNFYVAYISAVSHPERMAPGTYLGLFVPTGVKDAFPVNYDGFIPERRVAFHGHDGESLRTFLVEQDYAKITDSPRLVDVDRYNYLLSNTDVFPLFKDVFGLTKSIFVSELLIVDATSPENLAQFNRLYQQYSSSPAR